ncbi:MAG: TlpA family protein disulfide reductase [Candidatus Latescibacterota bacterium]
MIYPQGIFRPKTEKKTVVKLIATILTLAASSIPASGEQTARFTLKTIDGKYEPIDGLLKKGPVLITFWASWCKNCKEEMQALDKMLTEEVLSRFTVAAVTIDTPRSLMRARSYIEARKMKFLVCTDPNSELLKQFGGNAIPYTVIIDPDRTIAYRNMGYTPGDEQRIMELLRARIGAPGAGAIGKER